MRFGSPSTPPSWRLATVTLLVVLGACGDGDGDRATAPTAARSEQTGRSAGSGEPDRGSGTSASTAAAGGGEPTAAPRSTGAPPTTETTTPLPGTRYLDEVFADVEVQRGIEYGEAPGADGDPVALLLDLYQPAGDTASGRPALIWVHGGGFTTGSRSDEYFVTLAETFARRGYVTASIDYRLSERGVEWREAGLNANRSSMLDAQHDAQASVHWLRARAGELRVDPDRIAMGGSSAGAVTSLAVAYNSEDPGDSGNPGAPSEIGAAVSLSGAVFPDYVEAGEPPAMFVHATGDRTVPIELARLACDTITDAGIRCEMLVLEVEAHRLLPFAGEFVPSVAEFLAEQLDVA